MWVQWGLGFFEEKACSRIDPEALAKDLKASRRCFSSVASALIKNEVTLDFVLFYQMTMDRFFI